MSVKKKHTDKLLVVVQQCVSSSQICLYTDLRHLKDNIFRCDRSIELLRMLYGISESDLNAMMPQPDVLNIRLSIIKDRHQACPRVNYIVHSTSILYGIRIIIPLIMHLHNLPV